MIQRIQSLFLFLCGLGFGGQFMTDFATSTKAIPVLMADSVYEVQDSPVLLGITIIGIILPLVAIFLYNNRVLQMRLSTFSLVASILLPLVAFLLMYNERTGITAGAEIQDSVGAYLPLVSIITAVLARNYINKDEKLVKSMDRLR